MLTQDVIWKSIQRRLNVIDGGKKKKSAHFKYLKISKLKSIADKPFKS